MFSRLIPITTTWTGWGFSMANKCLAGSRGAESVEPQLEYGNIKPDDVKLAEWLRPGVSWPFASVHSLT